MKPENIKRAKRIRAAILDEEISLVDDIVDTLSSLRHLCDLKGLDFGQLDRIAHGRYLNERAP